MALGGEKHDEKKRNGSFSSDWTNLTTLLSSRVDPYSGSFLKHAEKMTRLRHKTNVFVKYRESAPIQMFPFVGLILETKPPHHPRRFPPCSKALLPRSSCIFFTLSNELSPWRATAFLYHPRLSALGAADKINIRSVQFSSLIWPTQSAKARRVSILVCRIYFIYYISTLYTSSISLSLLGSAFFCFPRFFFLYFGKKTSPSTRFLFHFPLPPLFPLGGSTF